MSALYFLDTCVCVCVCVLLGNVHRYVQVRSNYLPVCHVLCVVLNRGFKRFLQNCKKRLLASSCLSVRLFVRMEQLGSH